jgi:DNA polymerase-3 subunit epsilon
MSIAATDFIVVDTETTGGSAAHNRIIDIAAFHVRDGIILDKFQTLLNPGRPIPSWITLLTNITDDMVKNAPAFSEIAEKLRKFLEKGVFVAHNANFDFNFIQHEYLRLGETWDRPRVCTVKLARHLLPELPSRSLGHLCEEFLIDIWDRHRAAGDAEATVYVLKELLRRGQRDHGVHTFEDLETFQNTGPLHLPQGIDLAVIRKLPPEAGQYVFKDETGQVIHKGKAKNLRQRIQTYFRKSNLSEKSNRFRAAVRMIEVLS